MMKNLLRFYEKKVFRFYEKKIFLDFMENKAATGSSGLIFAQNLKRIFFSQNLKNFFFHKI